MLHPQAVYSRTLKGPSEHFILMTQSTDAACSFQKCSTNGSMFRLLCGMSNKISLNQLFKAGLVNHHNRQFLFCPLVLGSIRILISYWQFSTMHFIARPIRNPLFTSCTCPLLEHFTKAFTVLFYTSVAQPCKISFPKNLNRSPEMWILSILFTTSSRITPRQQAKANS